MRFGMRLLVMNLVAVTGCVLVVMLKPGANRWSVLLIAAVLAIGLVNAFAFLLPHLVRGGKENKQRGQILMTLILLILVCLLAWMWHRA